ncbi:MAG TPA: hypothetical protein VK668_06730 [Mucilaginibacter sp.]|nr:hypothetical protein [Mucilaginibacter sp.]
MLSESEILLTLDNSNKTGDYTHFISLGHPNSFLIDNRLNIFRGDNDKWAIAIERLGFNPRGGAIELEIYYYGNCLINLETYNGQISNYYSTYPVDQNSLNETTDGFHLNPDAESWLTKGRQIELSTNKQDYRDQDIDLKEYEPGQIGIEEAARSLIIGHRDLFRASENELYKSVPQDLKKILVLDEWHHRDFIEISVPKVSDEHLKYTYEFNKKMPGFEEMDFETFSNLFRIQELNNKKANQKEWDDNRPSSYETWQQLAKVIATGDVQHYKPTLSPNTHWKNWSESGSL